MINIVKQKKTVKDLQQQMKTYRLRQISYFLLSRYQTIFAFYSMIKDKKKKLNVYFYMYLREFRNQLSFIIFSQYFYYIEK
jgi:hypothetical protein